MNIKELYKNETIVIATMHEKERVIAPILEKHLGVKIVLPPDFDSDQFGTFTREIKRSGDQLETARKKAHIAIKMTGVDLAVSSEGSFGEHPQSPFIQSNFELTLFVDKKRGYEVSGHFHTEETNMNQAYIKNSSEALLFAKKVGFPEYGVILRKDEKSHSNIHKNIKTEEDLREIAEKMLSRPFVKKIFIETDMRAHRNPMRMEAIKGATEDMIKNLFSLCPRCQTPGFAVVNFEKGLECSYCNTPTDLPLYEILHCKKCNFSDKKLATKYGKTADPKYCNICNP